MTPTECPNPTRLTAFYDGTLVWDDHLRLARHMRDCPHCQKRASDAGRPVPTRPALPTPEVLPPLPGSTGGTTGIQTIVAPLTRVGSYMVRRLIGRGGMGTVYEAVCDHLGRVVAIKMLPAAVAIDPEYAARFQREMRAGGKLDHPNVVRVYHAGQQEGVPYLVMELIDGVDLARLIQAVGQLPVAEACEIARQAALGLAHAHEQEVVHRDMKPSNLMVSPGGVKLLDLGLAVFVTPVGRTDDRITGLTVLGTHDYMAPEQWANPADVTGLADVYGLGCVLFQMLVGRPPFGGPEYESPNAKKRAHLHTAPANAARLRQDVPAPLADLIARTLSKRPDERPSCAQLAEDLKVFARTPPPLARLVERTKLSPVTGFADGQPTALAPVAPATAANPVADTGPVTASADHPTTPTGHRLPPPAPTAEPSHNAHLWEIILGVTVLTILVLGGLAACLSGKF